MARPVKQVKQAKPRSKKRRSWAFVIVCAVLALLMVGVVLLDNLARGYLSDQIAGKVRSSLSLSASTPVTVSVAGTSVLVQLMSGKLDHIDVGIAQLALGTLKGSAELTADGIPIEAGKPTDRTRIVFMADQKVLATLFANTPGFSAGAVTVERNTIKLGTEVTLFGFTLPVGISFSPSVVKGQLTLTPTSISVNKQSFTAEQFTASAFGALADSLFVQHTVCIASILPKGFVLDRITASGSKVAVAVSAEKIVLDSKLMASRGTCPPA
ncbi:MAG: DUF2993 domain-containing protein [Lacisediminihabitans sp.]